MAPRGGSRKFDTSRMSAATSAMGRIGFGEKQVRSRMNKLLRVYGGVKGYPFIEDDAYKVLIEALLEEQEVEKRKEASTKGDSSNDQRVGDDTAGPSGGIIGSSNSHPVETQMQTELAEEGDMSREDSMCSQAVEATDEPAREVQLGDSSGLDLLASCASSSKPRASSTRRRRPCYGWIEDGDDDCEPDDWVYLPPAVDESLWPLLDAQLRRINNKSRGDERLEDM